MAFYLVLSLAATAGLFFLAGQDFVGAMQLLIYVGGTLVLLIFGVMLTSQERFVNMKTMAGDWVIGMIAGGALLSLLTCRRRSAFPNGAGPSARRSRTCRSRPNADADCAWACSARASIRSTHRPMSVPGWRLPAAV